MPKYSSATSALQKCLTLWQWLEQHPEANKAEAYSALNLERDLCSCPACQYAVDVLEQLRSDYQQDNERCDFCPLYPETDKHCENDGEPYAIWAYSFHTTKENSTAAAHSMCELINKRLIEYSKEQEQ